MTTWPRITVVTPSYNQGRFLRATLESIHRQAYPNLEHIVLDAASTDGSVDIIREFESRLSYWHSRPDRGQSHAINDGFRRSTGDILTWINSDDQLAPNALFTMAAALPDPDAPAWAIGGCLCVDEHGRETRRWSPAHVTLERTLNWGVHYFFQPAVFWTRAMWARCGPLDEHLHYAMDFDLWLAFFSVAAPLIIRDDIGVHRSHGASKTSTGTTATLREFATAIDKRLAHGPRRRGRRHLARQIVRHANAEYYAGAYDASRASLRAAIRTSPSVWAYPRLYQVAAKHVAGRSAVEWWWRLRARLQRTAVS